MCLSWCVAATATPATAVRVPAAEAAADGSYALGPEDTLLIHVKDEPEIPDGPYQIDLNGDLVVPEIGTIHAAGSSVADVTRAVTERCRRLLNQPVVHVSIAEFRSQRVTVLGEVGTPGVQQIRGRKTLYEAISDAGGLRSTAGGTIQISRRADEGPLPLEGVKRNADGQFETAEVDVVSLMKGRLPESNIAVRSNDVITVPRAALIYVLGAVRRPGGFELTERRSMSVMEALSLAQGTERTAGTKHARILRGDGTSSPREEISLDLNKLLAGKQSDPMLQPNDILVIPTSTTKAVSYRALEAVVNTGTGVAIYRPY